MTAAPWKPTPYEVGEKVIDSGGKLYEIVAVTKKNEDFVQLTRYTVVGQSGIAIHNYPHYLLREVPR